MKKLIIIGLTLAISLAFMASVAIAAPKPVSTYDPYAPNVGPSGQSAVAHMYLVEKDPSDWTIIEDGAWAKLNYDADSFVFNGHGLEPKTDYTLIRYTDPWPGSPVCLAEGTTNNGGNLNLAGEMLAGGPKVWLVLSSDVDCASPAMTAWNPTEYLFEYDLIP